MEFEAAEILVSFLRVRRCWNCNTRSTPMWRWVDEKRMCNACGIYMKKNNRSRTFAKISSDE